MEVIISILDYFFLVYGILLFLCYFMFTLFAAGAISKNRKRASLLRINDIKGAIDLPSVSLIAPAYNEGKTIIINVHSLLSIQYPYYKLIIVNDGSKDDSLNQLISEFKLEQISFNYKNEGISHAPIIAVYRSTDKKYKHLTIINKENGGRADALNCGIACANTNLVLCTDADCIIEQGAVLRMVRPYLEALDKEVIACGGAIGIANDSVVTNGILKEIRLPKSYVARIQVVEYIRAFLLGRMAWHYIDGLMLVSGAFGLYPRSRLLEIGGFDKTTVGEDLELCVRLRSHMEHLKLPYDVVYIPDTLCWTEAPSTYKIYITQRDRWARGLWETIKKHRKLFFNYKYGTTGLLFFPYWCFFELAAPFVEFFGIIYLIFLVFMGMINWSIAIPLFIVVYLLGCVFSTIAIFMYTINFKHYSKVSMIFKLLFVAYLESITSHPIMLFAELKGYYKKIFRIKSSWGAMTRKGFTTK